MHDENLMRRLEVNSVGIRYGQLFLDFRRDVKSLERDTRDLKRVIEWVTGVAKAYGFGRVGDFVFTEPEGEVEKGGVPGISMPFDSAVLFGLHLALKLDDDEALDTLIQIIRSDIERFLGRLARYRFVWRVLVKGVLGPDDEEGKAEITAEFERIKGAIKLRLRNGVEYPFLDNSMRDLVKILDENTIRRGGPPGQEVRPKIDGKPSIRHPGATQKMIDDLEEKLDVELPDDYIEFLKISNGMEGIWNGYFRQRFLAPCADVKNSPLKIDDEPPLLFSLIPYTELPNSFNPIWPRLNLGSCVMLNIEGRGDFLWLVNGEMMKKARKRLVRKWEEMAEGKEKKWVERVVGDLFGGMEELVEQGEDEEGWGVVYWDRAGLPVEVWGSFREWIEGLCVESEFPDIFEERREESAIGARED